MASFYLLNRHSPKVTTLLVNAAQQFEIQARLALASNLFIEPIICCYPLFFLYQKIQPVKSLFVIDPAEWK
jgi:hypothetical protein